MNNKSRNGKTYNSEMKRIVLELSIPSKEKSHYQVCLTLPFLNKYFIRTAHRNSTCVFHKVWAAWQSSGIDQLLDSSLQDPIRTKVEVCWDEQQVKGESHVSWLMKVFCSCFSFNQDLTVRVEFTTKYGSIKAKFKECVITFRSPYESKVSRMKK